MISLKSYLLGDADRDLESSYQRMIDLFLQAISLHAVEGDKAEHQRFQSEIGTLSDRLIPTLSISERFVVVGEVLRSLAEYNRQTGKFLHIQTAELQKMITMLTQTVIAVGANSESSIASLRDVEKALEQAQVVEDIHVVKAQLGEVLKSVRVEAQRQKQDGKAALETVQHELAKSQHRLISAAQDLDPVTGLPGKVEAGSQLQEAVSSPEPKFLLLAVVNRLQPVIARFGDAIGDQVLAVAAEHVLTALPSGDKLYRWEGPVLMAVLNRTAAIESVRAEVRRFAEKKLEKSFLTGSRSVVLPISTTWAIFPILPPLEALLRKVEIFTAVQKSHGSG